MQFSLRYPTLYLCTLKLEMTEYDLCTLTVSVISYLNTIYQQEFIVRKQWASDDQWYIVDRVHVNVTNRFYLIELRGQ